MWKESDEGEEEEEHASLSIFGIAVNYNFVMTVYCVSTDYSGSA